eukprot:15470317-Alexandrium_andersonii.AAC.1
MVKIHFRTVLTSAEQRSGPAGAPGTSAQVVLLRAPGSRALTSDRRRRVCMLYLNAETVTVSQAHG